MMRVIRAGLIVLLSWVAPTSVAHAAGSDRARPLNADVTGTVTDSASGSPLQSAEISVTLPAGGVVSNTITDALGHFRLHNLAAGSYAISVHLVGFRPISRPLVIPGTASAPIDVAFAMTAIGVNLNAFQIIATVPIAIDTRTGNQIFKENDYHGAPTNTTSAILQTSIAGAARAPTGEVHIRGQHAEYTYYVDGVPVPPGIAGSLNELFDPDVVGSINFQTGGWDAEYGGRNAAVINVTTKIPSGGSHGSVSSYVGSFDGGSTTGDRGYDGQTVSASDNQGPWGFYL
ncbi:MAG: carboxypeptidase regulatory-like domain-containing protein, partial [Gemmatimonadaceae bacterium]